MRRLLIGDPCITEPVNSVTCRATCPNWVCAFDMSNCQSSIKAVATVPVA